MKKIAGSSGNLSSNATKTGIENTFQLAKDMTKSSQRVLKGLIKRIMNLRLFLIVLPFSS